MNETTEAQLYEKFGKNIDDLIGKLIQVFELSHKQEVAHLSDPLLRWLDFRFRYIDPFPRPIEFSNKFPKSSLPENADRALKEFCARIRNGSDINPYQGRGLTLRNDFSGEKRDARTDLLWADWGIHHFHLSDKPLPADRYFSYPADYLAFCLVGANVVALIDILPHPEKTGFSDPEIIQTVASSWPAFIEQFKMHGASGGEKRTQAEIHELRGAGINAPLYLNGSSYIGPGLGVTSAGTSTRVSIAADRLHIALKDLVKAVCDPLGPFRPPQISELSSTDFVLAATPKGLTVFEENSRYAFLLPKLTQNRQQDSFSYLHDLILPSWALRALTTNQARANYFSTRIPRA